MSLNRFDRHRGIVSSMTIREEKYMPPSKSKVQFSHLGIKAGDSLPESVIKRLRLNFKDYDEFVECIETICSRIFVHTLIQSARHFEEIEEEMAEKRLTDDELQAIYTALFAEMLVYYVWQITNNDDIDIFFPVACLEAFVCKLLSANDNKNITIGIVKCYLRLTAGESVDHYTLRVCIDRDEKPYAMVHLDPVSRLLDSNGLSVSELHYSPTPPHDYDEESANDDTARRANIAFKLWGSIKTRDQFFQMCFKSLDPLTRLSVALMGAFQQKEKMPIYLGIQNMVNSTKVARSKEQKREQKKEQPRQEQQELAGIPLVLFPEE